MSLLLLALACKPEPVKIPDDPDTGEVDVFIDVVDLGIESGLQDYVHGGTFKRGRGCSIVDMDNDGLQDVFLANPEDESYMLRNIGGAGNLAFEPDPPGYDEQLVWHGIAGDMDNDGDNDMFIAQGGLEGREFDKLMMSQLVETGEFGMLDVSLEAGIRGPITPEGDVWMGASTGGALVDYDNDSDLDIWVNGHVFPIQLNEAIPEDGTIGRNQLWRNNGDGTYTDVAWTSGMTHRAPTRFSTWLDFDNDGDMDLFENVWKVDFNKLWRNQLAETGTATFEDVTDDFGLAGADLNYPLESFVSASADFNNDGWDDLLLFVRGWTTEGPYRDGNVLLINVQGTGFVDVAGPAQLNNPFEPGLRDHLSLGVMGATPRDVNADGIPDVFIGNGGPGAGFPNQLFVSAGYTTETFDGVGEVTFPLYENWSWRIDFPAPQAADAPEYPEFPYRTHAGCVGDLDGDGFVELAVTNGGMKWVGGLAVREPNRLFSFFQDPAPPWLTIELAGNGLTTNRNAIGARITVFASDGEDEWEIHDTVRSSNGFPAQNGYHRYFGLTGASAVDRVWVQWPDGSQSELFDVDMRQKILIEQP